MLGISLPSILILIAPSLPPVEGIDAIELRAPLRNATVSKMDFDSRLIDLALQVRPVHLSIQQGVSQSERAPEKGTITDELIDAYRRIFAP